VPTSQFTHRSSSCTESCNVRDVVDPGLRAQVTVRSRSCTRSRGSHGNRGQGVNQVQVLFEEGPGCFSRRDRPAPSPATHSDRWTSDEAKGSGRAPGGLGHELESRPCSPPGDNQRVMLRVPPFPSLAVYRQEGGRVLVRRERARRKTSEDRMSTIVKSPHGSSPCRRSEDVQKVYAG